MGTKNSYSGSAAGGDVRDGLDDWLASLPGGDNASPVAGDSQSQPTMPLTSKPSANSPARRVLAATKLFRSSRGGSSSGRGRRSADPPIRSTTEFARSAGRGAAAAYAYRAGDAQVLRDLGLDYDALRENPNIFDVAHQITQRVCEDLPQGTIETAEQLEVVGRLAEWLVERDGVATDVSLGQIAEEAVALILAEAYLVETAAKLNTKDMTGAQRAEFEDGVREAAEELAAHASLSPAGPSPSEFTEAIEDGLEYLRTIYEED
ncbi:hypothetical protein E0H26_28885 [Micromonospora zingiberis]|uniref:Uncharacterized protein n=1 Tax=Micromonospora zingiberis TaxID=2053011 RepID=A0A4R0FUZ6_9ACTN|nr:hypothetical protein [Micromonospora zingiberis]TCB87730.1 hypothetical protein E0H26_28885 [Micromonospora zingiberis]